MRQGRSNRDVSEGWKKEPRPNAKLPGAVAQLGQMQGNHVMGQGERLGYKGLREYINQGEGYRPPQGPSAASGVGGGRDVHPSGSQRRS
jgi:hypothetical protein